MDYIDFTVEEFVMDPSFQQWVLHPTEESDLFWAQWLFQHPKKETIIDQAREIILSLDFKDNLSDYEIEEEWEKVQYKISTTAKEKQVPLPDLYQKWWHQYQNIAALFIGLALIFGIVVANKYGNQVGNVAYTTSYEQTKIVNLPDGSTVILNANSTVIFPDNWNPDKPREVWLKGEALFSIQHTPNHQRFIVHTDDKADIEVLGTQFYVYNRRQKVQVVLQQGKVQIAGLEQSGVIMKPGELVEWQLGKWKKQQVNSLLFTSWVGHELLFEHTSLADVAQKLQDNYGLKVSFENDALKILQFTGSLPTNDITECINSLSKVFDINITYKRKQLTIR